MTSTDPFNYFLLLKDNRRNGESASVLYVLGFHVQPGHNNDIWEDEMRAMGHALNRYGAPVHPVTPHSNVSPTGRWFWNEPGFSVFDRHVLYQQNGGLDC